MERLESILTELSHLDLNNSITRKQSCASGLGGQCDVFSAWSTVHKRRVAVKRVRAFLRKDLALAKRLAKEIRIWAKLEHENVLPFLGYLIEGKDSIPSLVSEWMERGTLFDFKRSFPRGGFETCVMLRKIASGLAYLHAKEIIHADLKTQNILISLQGNPLLADFGMSLTLSHSESSCESTNDHMKGTIRFMAIELFRSDNNDDSEMGKHNKMTDVWAFGMVIYELISWKVPYWNKSSNWAVINAIKKGEYPAKPEPEASLDEVIFEKLWSLCEECWLVNCSLRPTARHIEDQMCVYNISREAKLVDIASERAQMWFFRCTRRIVHADIKKPNILVKSGEPLMADFGLSFVLDAMDALVTRNLASISTKLRPGVSRDVFEFKLFLPRNIIAVKENEHYDFVGQFCRPSHNVRALIDEIMHENHDATTDQFALTKRRNAQTGSFNSRSSRSASSSHSNVVYIMHRLCDYISSLVEEVPDCTDEELKLAMVLSLQTVLNRRSRQSAPHPHESPLAFPPSVETEFPTAHIVSLE